MKHLIFRRNRCLAVTFVELLVVIAIITLMLALALPNFNLALKKAQSMKCAGNLRAIGVAASAAATDNNNQYPEIDQAALPIYPPPHDPVGGLVAVLGPYGITTNTIQCPTDMSLGSLSSFQQYQSSYMWNAVFDDESLTAPVVYVTPTRGIPVNNTRVRLCTDFVGIHHNRQNILWGDGHVSSH